MEKEQLPIILLVNGPNLNMLGKRSKEHYGSFTLSQVESAFETKAQSLSVQAKFFQSNDEGAIVTAIHEAMTYAAGIVINAGAYTHYSYAIFDALLLCGLPVMEVHISNIHKREAFRNVSVIMPACVGQVYGLGLDSYLVGLEKLVKEHIMLDKPKKEDHPSRFGNEDLSLLREQISEVDAQLMTIFNRRMDLAEEIAHSKILSGTAVYDASREAEVSDLARQRAGSDMSTRVDSLMKTMMRISREKQYDILLQASQNWKMGQELTSSGTTLEHIHKVSYGGTLGSYSETAAQKLFPSETLLPAQTFSSACERVLSGEADAAVLPLENTIGGTVDNVYELLQKKNLHIVKATSVVVAHCLAVIPGTKLSDIKSVSSHPQGLAQCSEMISKMHWDVIAMENTAFAAAEVKMRGDRSIGAIASAEAAKRNGLEIISLEISNSASNQTRFIAVTKDLIITPHADRISTLLHLPHRSGALVSALEVFADRGLNLSSIFSRPIQNTPGEYSFFLDFLCPAMGQDALLALFQLSSEMPYIKVLGWYEES